MLDIISLVGGIVYGYINPGKEDKKALLKKGAKIGIVLGIVLGVLNLISGGGILAVGANIMLSLFAIVYLTIFFIIGAFIGDFLEAKIKK